MACGVECERLDVVDADDSVVGVAGRGEVHRKGLYHRSVHVFVVDGNGRLYLQRRSFQKEEHPGRWDSSASGHVMSGETYIQAAQRELEEEIGVSGVPEQLVKVRACKETGMEHSVLYLLCLGVSDLPPRPNPDEVMEGSFFEIREIEERLSRDPEAFSPSFRILFRLYLEHTRGRGA